MDVAPSTKTILRYKTYNDTHTTDYSLSNCFIQVYLVAGGYDGSVRHSSTAEIYEGGKWTEVGALPAAVEGVKGGSLQNTVYMMGKGSVMTGVLLIICSQVAMMAHHNMMISGSLMPTQSSGRGLTKCQSQDIAMPCPLWQTRILQDIVIINLN